ncbi:N-6 DNA methylase [Amycolatopsis sp. RTGN1]|uniref:N-6 DNA methylase n=1 Tax=Amycolatopsis ponsaeliensis TaxID=2992142 RepID=UPI00254A748F|nr:N-6 DNA methylase [Amycolatopsis sp. RTGN1]
MASRHPTTPDTPFPTTGLHWHGHTIWVPLRGRWTNVEHQPEEKVRQEWVRRLWEHGKFSLQQMDQERRTHHGRRSPRADIVVWHSSADKEAGREPVLVVETKADEGPVRPADFWQGESYARAAGARFLVLANSTGHVTFELITGLPGRARQINDWPTSEDLANNSRLEALIGRLEVFDREQFQRVLFDCHSLLRDNHAMSPDRAFDTISKVLFIKLHIERSQAHETFTTKYLSESSRFFKNPRLSIHEQMFDQTKAAYSADDLFPEDDRLDISGDTFRDLVSKLERFNLSKTGEDIKGIAFERFLGTTFRGNLGQYFTPRPVVDFMVSLLNPKEGELICDPAAGSGGFLIRVFDHIRDEIAADIAKQRQEIIDSISAEYPEDANEINLVHRDQRIESAVEELNKQLAPSRPDGGPTETRVGKLAWKCIYGADKEPRAARTAKMNMIMHGDGHGGIHWHDGLVDTNGIFEGRFDVVVTNPPFGAIVNASQRIGASPEVDVSDDRDYRRRQQERYGAEWVSAHDRVAAARGTKILDMFEIGENTKSRKTEQMFLERCLRLLHPGGRLGIVLPNGNLNSSSQAWLRRWAEGKAFLRAVVALPAETFKFSGASVNASVVFMQKFTKEDEERWNQCWDNALELTEVDFAPKRTNLLERMTPDLLHSDDADLMAILEHLERLGIIRTLPELSRIRKVGLIRSGPETVLRAPRWSGQPNQEARALKVQYKEKAAHVPGLQAAMTTLRSELKKLDIEQSALMWATVRTMFDYDVFMATPTRVGITATGETGDSITNDLPAILHAWQEFKATLKTEDW